MPPKPGAQGLPGPHWSKGPGQGGTPETAEPPLGSPAFRSLNTHPNSALWRLKSDTQQPRSQETGDSVTGASGRDKVFKGNQRPAKSPRSSASPQGMEGGSFRAGVSTKASPHRQQASV